MRPTKDLVDRMCAGQKPATSAPPGTRTPNPRIKSPKFTRSQDDHLRRCTMEEAPGRPLRQRGIVLAGQMHGQQVHSGPVEAPQTLGRAQTSRWCVWPSGHRLTRLSAIPLFNTSRVGRAAVCTSKVPSRAADPILQQSPESFRKALSLIHSPNSLQDYEEPGLGESVRFAVAVGTGIWEGSGGTRAEPLPTREARPGSPAVT